MIQQQRSYLPAPQARLRVERRAADGPEQIVGYGAVYFRAGDPSTEYELWPGCVERIMPGAGDVAAQQDDARCCFNHNGDQLLGRRTAGTLEVWSDDVGVGYRATPPDTSFARDLLESLRRGDVRESSFLFACFGPATMVPRGRVVWAEEQRDGQLLEVREIHEFTLFELGPVTIPAYGATTAGVGERGRRPLSEEQRAAILQERREQLGDRGPSEIEVLGRMQQLRTDRLRLGNPGPVAGGGR